MTSLLVHQRDDLVIRHRASLSQEPIIALGYAHILLSFFSRLAKLAPDIE